MAGFVLKNNFIEFNSKINQQVLNTTIGTKFSNPYTCLFMDKFEITFSRNAAIATPSTVQINQLYFLHMDTW